MSYRDTFPARNLNPEAEPWGREIEKAIRELQYSDIRYEGDASGQNRTAAASLSSLSRQVVKIQQLVQQVEDVYQAIPKPAQANNVAVGFGLGGGWNTLVTTTLGVPAGSSYVRLQAIGSGQLVANTTTSVVTSRHRLLYNGGSPSPETPGAWYPDGSFKTVMSPAWTWEGPVTPGDTLSVQFQAIPDDPAAYPYAGDAYAAVSIIATFTG